MASYIIRLDDAAEKRDISKWNQIEQMLDAYAVKPLAGVIPCCMDPEMEHYEKDACFWERFEAGRKKAGQLPCMDTGTYMIPWTEG